MTTVQALREVYKALGGTGTEITDNMTIPEALAKIATVTATVTTAATTKELPAYSATENGRVLKVADGALTWGTDNIEA